VDGSEAVFGDPYPAEVEIVSDVPSLVRAVADELEREPVRTSWETDEIAHWRQRLAAETRTGLPEPRLGGVSAERFFAGLRAILPAGVPVVTDSGLHQYLVRSHLPVLAPRTLLVPTDFQSMGFGIPTAIGAAVATGGPAVAVVGDGGFNIAGSELATAAREGLLLVAIVVVDRQLGLIRAEQALHSGRPSGVEVPCVDLELFARSVGADYLALSDGDPAPLAEKIGNGRVTLVELPASDTAAFARARARGRALAAARTVLGPDWAARAVDLARRLRDR
jgi:acetolactate synthase-1/2/3 large subunit